MVTFDADGGSRRLVNANVIACSARDAAVSSCISPFPANASPAVAKLQLAQQEVVVMDFGSFPPGP